VSAGSRRLCSQYSCSLKQYLMRRLRRLKEGLLALAATTSVETTHNEIPGGRTAKAEPEGGDSGETRGMTTQTSLQEQQREPVYKLENKTWRRKSGRNHITAAP